MARFCPHDFHQTTEEDLQHIALGGGDYEYAVWEVSAPVFAPPSKREQEQARLFDRAHILMRQAGVEFPPKSDPSYWPVVNALTEAFMRVAEKEPLT